MAGILGASDVKLAVILCAAGRSSRFSEGGVGHRSKLDEDLGGKPVLQRAMELFHTRDETCGIVVAGPADDDAFGEFSLRHADKVGLFGGTLCRGGEERWLSVKAALDLVPDECTHVAVHDAARPCTPPEVIDRVIDAGVAHGAAVPCVGVGDTLKRIGETREVEVAGDPVAAILGESRSKEVRFVGETVDRAALVGVQTPQVFEIGLLRRAYAQDDLASTDDSQLVERLVEDVALVDGDPRNIKITLAGDVAVARAILGVKGPEGRPTHKRF